MFDTSKFILKASGLYVPSLIGLAVNPLGRFQPCGVGNCCNGDPCSVCQSGTMSSSYAVTFADILETCTKPGDGTYSLDQFLPSSCTWLYYFSDPVLRIQLNILGSSVDVALHEGIYPYVGSFSCYWSLDMTPDGEGRIDCAFVDLDIPFVSQALWFCEMCYDQSIVTVSAE